MNHIITLLIIFVAAGWMYLCTLSKLFIEIPLWVLIFGLVYGMVYGFVSCLRAEKKDSNDPF